MPAQPVLINDAVGVFPPRLFGSVAYYARVARYSSVVIDPAVRYNKRDKDVHRYTIAHTQGALALTVPVSREPGSFLAGNLTWQGVNVSPHGRWWEVHLSALDSAYGRTPYYEFYRDRLLPLFAPRPLPQPESVSELIIRANEIILPIVAPLTSVLPAHPAGIKTVSFIGTDFTLPQQQPYYQVRAERYGFLPDLSILDLIFNLGPEAAIYLQSL